MGIVYRQTPQIQEVKPVDFVPPQLQAQFGRGFALPFACEQNNWRMLSGLPKIEQNIYVTIMTPVGSHLMQPDFGSLVPMLLMEHYDAVLKRQLTNTIINALKTWVPEITVTNVLFDDSLITENVVLITIEYQVNGTVAIQSVTVGYITPDSIQYPPGMFIVHNKPVFKK